MVKKLFFGNKLMIKFNGMLANNVTVQSHKYITSFPESCFNLKIVKKIVYKQS